MGKKENIYDSVVNFSDSEYQRNIFKSLLLLTLAVSGNFIGSTLSCQVQYQMTNNVFVKHIILIFVIYLTLTVLDPNSGNKSPMYSIKNTFIIWLFYIMFTKQNLTFSTIAVIALATAYMSDQFVSYYEKNDMTEENKKTLDYTKSIRDLSFNGGTLVISIGFLSYFIAKYNEYGNNFDMTKFIFGTQLCDSLK